MLKKKMTMDKPSFNPIVGLSANVLAEPPKGQLDKPILANLRTGIYYYPDCRLIRPQKTRAVAFGNVEEAESAGFRLCGHCRTQETKRLEKMNTVSVICNYLKENYREKITLGSLSGTFGMSSHRIHSVFMSTVGVSPRKYVEEYRITKLKERLSSGQPVSSAIYAVGHNSTSWIYTDSRSMLGMTPSKYRNGSKGESILYVTGHTDFGEMIVAYTDHGICGVTLVDSEEMIMGYLRKEFPKAIITRSDDTNNYISGILDYLKGKVVDVPLDFHGTDFQLKVWGAIRRIPHGTTVTYSDVADMIGKPKAVRAVANACASNPVPLIVPCHRVIRKGGNLGGYGLGLERKRQLLELENETRTNGSLDD
ncbi:MAG: methylated-DNA--[protein]-cysteine S-methyltransferase [Thermoplasmataceae archaeon]